VTMIRDPLPMPNLRFLLDCPACGLWQILATVLLIWRSAFATSPSTPPAP